jgi:uncharacterized membrane protein
MTIKNPIEWSGAQFVHAAHAVENFGRSLGHIADRVHSPAPAVRRISLDDLRDALARGLDDFKAYRSDVLVVGVIYAVIGIVIGRAAFGSALLPLIFPLASGFAIVGPFAAVGLYEMSRRREQGQEARWSNAFDVVREPSFGAIAMLGLMLIAIFGLWIASAWWVYEATLGPAMPASLGIFEHEVVDTHGGHVMIALGMSVGFLFALAAMAISVVSFPLLLDRDVGLDTAVRTSIRAVMANPRIMAAWGVVVAGLLLIGSLPFFVGLAVVVPVLGHATWHLYRKLVE